MNNRTVILSDLMLDYVMCDREFSDFVDISLDRFERYDWGDTDKASIDVNAQNIQSGNGVIFAKYIDSRNRAICIVTDDTQDTVTIVFGDEY